jgi:glycosyltransferase involved in cell wall biosynthesis
MRVLFIHQNFPGQFRYLAAAVAAQGHEVRALAITPRHTPPRVSIHTYSPNPTNAGGGHPWAVDFETKTVRAHACARKMVELRATGFVPDLVVGHPGWGETWMVKDVWPRTRLLAFQEFFYGADVNFDPEFRENEQECRFRIRAKNASLLPGLDSMDWGLSPTTWQRAQFPADYRQRISVIFDGVDTERVTPERVQRLTLGDPAVTLERGDEIVTFVNRNLEPYRGYHVFMRALPRLLELRPRARIVIVGGDGVSYGSAPPRGTWRDIFLNEVRERIDLARVHFVGMLAYGTLVNLLRMSCCHVYLTYPFVLSWSMVDAMSTGAVVLGSRTPPVEELISDGENGLLVDFFDSEAIAARTAEVLTHADRFEQIRQNARRTVVERYSLQRQCLPRQLALLQSIARGETPPT